jgi:hypothetical protein
MRITIGIKIFGIAVGLLILMAVVALLCMRMTRTVDDQLVIVDHNYFPAYVALAEANIRSVEESAYARRLLLAVAERPGQRCESRGPASADRDRLARLDVRIESLQEERRRYEAALSRLLAAAEIGNKGLATELLSELDDRWDDFDRKN